MKLNVKWKWTLSALVYVALVLVSHFMYTELSYHHDVPTEQMQDH
ncbi:hypothetical protein [Bacillus sp. Bos-x628]